MRTPTFSPRRGHSVCRTTVVDRALEELTVEGSFDETVAEAHPTVVSLVRDVLDHGEVHATWSDSDDEVQVRRGTASFDFEGELIAIDDGITVHSSAVDLPVNWEKPMNVYGSEG